ncbi:HSP70/90 co-chaperone [Blastocladiella emersonii ATCC 22665]|nr:HSP70/90 co-chaperone [Blastocladiella emersonii ATCC 22665]
MSTSNVTNPPVPRPDDDDDDFDLAEAMKKMRSRLGPDGKPIVPKWAMSPETLEEDMNAVPLFMRSLPSDADDAEANPELAALQSLIYDGTPEEIAENFKNQGNEMYRDGPKYYTHAVQFYTKGIDQKCADAKLNSVLYSNRAAVHFEQGNFRKCVNDCIEAIKLNQGNVKAYFRAGRAYTRLERFNEAVSALTQGLTLDANNGSMKVALEEATKKKHAAEQADAERAASAAAAAAAESQVTAAIERYGIQTATLDTHSALPSAEYASHRPTWDRETDTLTFPCLVLYPEFNQSDFITHFDVRSTFAEQLQPILDEAPAPWDPSHTYRSKDVDIFFLTFDTDANKRRLVKVGKKLSLLTVLKLPWARVVNGVVEFLVLHRTNKFCTDYVETYRKRA